MIQLSKTFIGVFLFGIAIVIVVLFFDNQRLQKQLDKKADSKIDSIAKEELISKESREVIKRDIEELEKEKAKPYGKKDFSNNKSVTDAERYFSERYNSKDSVKNR